MKIQVTSIYSSPSTSTTRVFATIGGVFEAYIVLELPTLLPLACTFKLDTKVGQEFKQYIIDYIAHNN